MNYIRLFSFYHVIPLPFLILCKFVLWKGTTSNILEYNAHDLAKEEH